MRKTSGASLFQRMQASSAGEGRSLSLLNRTEYLHQLIESVRSHLESLLNSRAGASQSSVSYGLEDFNDAAVGSKDQAMSIAQDIKRCISEFESRLCNLQVIFSGYKEDDPTMLQFAIKCSFVVDSQQDQVSIELYLDKNRQFRVM